MSLLFLFLKPLLLMLVRKVFKKQMKEFAVQMMEEYAAIGVDRYIPILASSDETSSLKYLDNLNSELF